MLFNTLRGNLLWQLEKVVECMHSFTLIMNVYLFFKLKSVVVAKHLTTFLVME